MNVGLWIQVSNRLKLLAGLHDEEHSCREDGIMPYRDPEAKKKWEQEHRSQRLTRRRELRQIETAWKEAHPEVQDSGAGFLLALGAGGGLAAYNPKLATGAGGLTLLLAALYKKDWSWWILGIFILALGLFFQWNDKDEKKKSYI
jgi:hypothetical protein